MSVLSSIFSEVRHFFLLSFVLMKEIWIVAALLLGVILLVVWKVKKRGKVMLSIACTLVICSAVLSAVGCYNAYVRPKTDTIQMNSEQLCAFGAYLVHDENFLRDFLPNNGSPMQSMNGNEKSSKVVDFSLSGLDEDLVSMCYSVEAYKDEAAARQYFEEDVVRTDDSNAVLVSVDGYSVYAPAVEQNAHFFNIDVENGVDNSIFLRVYILYDRYIISFWEENWVTDPIFYRLAKNERFFDEGYTLDPAFLKERG